MSSYKSSTNSAMCMSKIKEAHERIKNLQSIKEHLKELHSSKYLSDKKGKIKIEENISHDRQIFEQIVREVKETIEKISQNENSLIAGSREILLDQRHALTANLSVVLSEFRKMELEQKNNEKKELKEHLQAINPRMSTTEIENEIECKLESHNFNFKDTESERRFKNISEMIRSIDEINSIIMEVSRLVDSQTDYVDQIEVEVSASKAYSEKTNTNLAQVRAKKRRWRFIKICLIAAITLMAILLVAYLFNTFVSPFINK